MRVEANITICMQASVMPERLISTSWSALWLRSNVQQAPMTHDPDAGCRLKQPKRSAEFHNTIRRRERQPHQHGSLQHGLYCALCAAMCLSIRPCSCQRSDYKRQSLRHRLYYREHHVGRSWTDVRYQLPDDRPSNKCNHRHHLGVLCGTQTTGPAVHVPIDRPACFWYLTGDRSSYDLQLIRALC